MTRPLAIGLDSDSTFRHFLIASDRLGLEAEAVSLRHVVASGRWRIRVPDDGANFIEVEDQRIELSPERPVFARLISLEAVQAPGQTRDRWSALVRALRSWLSLEAHCVINRPGGHSHNATKALHEAWLASQGLLVPASITTSDVAAIRAFAAGRDVIVKSSTGVRAYASRLAAESLHSAARLGPVHIQECVEGTDLRVHVVDEQALGLQVISDSFDYRRGGASNRYQSYQLASSLEEILVAATHAMGLSFAGWDFKLDSEGRAWCLEANPMPGYASYDRRLDGAITSALVSFLTGGGC
jgi:glutathione synthase/RimK-type ligase-like ATP-grasp enzyme